MENIRIRTAGLILACVTALSSYPAYAEDISVDDYKEETENIQAETVEDSAQISRLVADNWNDDYFGEITISPDSSAVQKDGEDVSLRKELDISKHEERRMLESSEQAEQYINEETDYQADIDSQGTVHITDPYQTCRLIVYADKLDSSYGAERVLYDEDAGKYTLQFATREQTQQADEELTAILGEENCNPDEVLTGTMLSVDDGEDYESTENSYKAVSWGTKYMGLDRLKSMYDKTSLGDENVTVAIIDTGINRQHVMFDDRKIIGRSFCGKNLASKSFSPNDYVDYEGHGSHVAGIVADGTPKNVSIMMLRAFGYYDGEIATTDSLLIEAMEYASQNGADVLNMSFGEKYKPSRPQTKYNNALKKLYNNGCAVVAAAGNADVSNLRRTVNYPAVLSTTIAVTALNSQGEFDGIYSCFGSTVDFAAPGTDIKSASYKSDTAYRKNSGTSMASPHLCAAAAYVKMVEKNASVKRVKQVLRQYSEDLGQSGKDIYYGYGAVRMSNYFANEQQSGNILMAESKLENKKMTYTGEPIENPMNISVYTNTGEMKTLTSEDYDISYENNVNIGTAKAVATAKGIYSGSIVRYFTIIPEDVTINRLANSSSKKLKVYWNPAKKAGGYQIRYASDIRFSNSIKTTVSGRRTSEYTFNNINKGKYYVSIRAYKTVSGKKIWGNWSDASEITVEK